MSFHIPQEISVGAVRINEPLSGKTRVDIIEPRILKKSYLFPTFPSDCNMS